MIMTNEIVLCQAHCLCGCSFTIRTKNPFNIPKILSKRGWRIIDPYKCSFDRTAIIAEMKTNWRCPQCVKFQKQ